MGAQERLGSRTLQEGARRRVDRRAQEIIGGSVTNIELDARVELRDVDEVGRAERSLFVRRLGRERFRAQFRNGADGCDAEDARPILAG